jgi:PKHD-type hydroxylase
MQVRISGGDEERGPIIYPLDPTASTGGQQSPRFLETNNYVSAPMIFAGIFTAAECDLILSCGQRAPKLAGRMMYARYRRRNSDVAWLGVRPDTLWIFEKLRRIFTSVNRWYAFQLSGFVDELQFTAYETGGGIDWHVDTGGGQTSTRKISVSVQLSDGAAYTGGDLELGGCANLVGARGRGSIIVFPSFLVHRVIPVTSGARFSLVAWAHGPVFK